MYRSDSNAICLYLQRISSAESINDASSRDLLSVTRPTQSENEQDDIVKHISGEFDAKIKTVPLHTCDSFRVN